MATPVFDEEAAKRLKAAKGLAIQGAAVPTQQPGQPAPLPPSNVQQTQQAAAITSAVGQQAAQQTAQQGQMAVQQSQLQLQQQEMQNKQRLAEREIAQKAFLSDADLLQGLQLNAEKRQADERLTAAEIATAKRSQRLGLETDTNLSFLTRQQREQLAALGADVKEKVFDGRLQFARDESGRKFSNERQLADYVIMNAKTEAELQNKLMIQKLMYQRQMQLMEAAQAKVNEALRQAFADKGRELTQQSQEYIATVKASAERAMARKKARGAAMGQIISGAFTIGGAVIGALATGGVGTAAGAAAGASIGGAVGNVAASQANKG